MYVDVGKGEAGEEPGVSKIVLTRCAPFAVQIGMSRNWDAV